MPLENLRLMPFPERNNLGDGFHSDYASLIVNVSTISKLIILEIILETRNSLEAQRLLT